VMPTSTRRCEPASPRPCSSCPTGTISRGPTPTAS
jgi:hypothetical protein